MSQRETDELHAAAVRDAASHLQRMIAAAYDAGLVIDVEILVTTARRSARRYAADPRHGAPPAVTNTEQESAA